MRKIRPIFNSTTKKRTDLPVSLNSLQWEGRNNTATKDKTEKLTIFKYILTQSFRHKFKHYVFGRWCMSADVCLYIIKEGVQNHYKQDEYALKKIHFISPLICEKDINYIIELKLSEFDDLLQLEVSSKKDDECEITTHMQCQLELTDIKTDCKINVVENNDNLTTEKSYLYEYFNGVNSAIEIGGIYEDSGKINHVNGFYQSILDLDSIKNIDNNNKAIPIIGKCFSGPICISEKENKKDDMNEVMLPHKIESMFFFGSFKGTLFKITWNIISEVAGYSTKTNVCIRDKTDNVIIKISGLHIQLTNYSNFIKNVSDKNEILKIAKINRSKKTIVEELEGCSTSTFKQELAVIGISGVFPKANSIYELWDNLKNGKCAITDVPESRWQEFDGWYDGTKTKNYKSHTNKGGFIDNIDKFDYKYFSITKADAELMDPHQRIMLQEAIKAIQNAAINESYLKKHYCGVFVGCSKGDYDKVLEKCGVDLEGKAFTGTSASLIAANISYYLDLKGPAYTVDTACSSSLTAVHIAAQSILSGECELAIVGGVNLFLSPTALIHTTQVGMQSKSGYCRTFDDTADGTVFSEACTAIVIKKLNRAIADNDPIYAVITGSSINQDGKTNGITAPSSKSQTDLIKQALKKSNTRSSEIKYVEAHGTATPLGDPIEVHALSEAYKGPEDSKSKCLIGSIKSNIGHSGYSAGLVGFIKCALSIKYSKIPPTINFSKANKNIAFEKTPFEVATKLSDWPKSNGNLNYCAVSSFGFGGSNAHVILRSYHNSLTQKEEISKKNCDTKKYILFSGNTEEDLVNNIGSLYRYLLFCVQNDYKDDLNIENIAFTLELSRQHYGCRLAVVANSVRHLITVLCEILEDEKYILPGEFINIANSSKTESSKFDDEKCKESINVNSFEFVNQWLKGDSINNSILNKYSTAAKRINLPGYSFKESTVWPENRVRNGVSVNTSRGEGYSVGDQQMVQNNQINLNSIIQILSEITKLKTSEIRPEMSIPDLGIDSINIMKIKNIIYERYGANINLGKIYAHKNIKEFYEYLQHAVKITNTNKEREQGNSRTEITRITGKTKLEDGVAIIGYSYCLPGASKDDELWNILDNGKSTTESIEFDTSYYKLSDNKGLIEKQPSKYYAGLIEDKVYFDYEFFGIDKNEAIYICPQHRQLLQHTYSAIENAGVNIKNLSESKVGVFVAVGDSNYDTLIENTDVQINLLAATGTLASLASNRISYQFDFKGPSETINTACSSGLVALSHAVEALEQGECDYAVVGASNIITSPFGHVAFGKNKLLSNDGYTKPFIEGGTGFVRSEGTVVYFLQSTVKAVEEKSNINAVIRSIAVGHGGRGGALSAPNPIALSETIDRAYYMAKVSKDDVTYIEAHGTGTELGDTIEIESIRDAFFSKTKENIIEDNKKNDKKSILIGSVKANLGHTEVVSGLTGILKIILQYKHNKIPRAGYSDENIISPLLSCSFLELNTDNTVWKNQGSTIRQRIAGVNSIGLGGVNAHAVISDYISTEASVSNNISKTTTDNIAFLFTESNEEELRRYLKIFVEYLNSTEEIDLLAIASTLAYGRVHQNERIICIARTREELIRNIQTYIKETGQDIISQNNASSNKQIPRMIRRIVSESTENENESDDELIQTAKKWLNGDDTCISNLVSVRQARLPIPGKIFKKQPCWINKEEPVRKASTFDHGYIRNSDYYKSLTETSWFGENNA